MRPPFDIVMLALPRWDGPYSSTAFSLAKELSKANRVFYIDNPFTIKDLFFHGRSAQIRKRISALIFGRNACTVLAPMESGLDDSKQKLFAITPPVTIPVNFLPEGFLYSFLSKLNNKLFFYALKKTFDKFKIKDFIFINVFNPFYALEFPGFFRPKLFVYYSVDNIQHSRYVQKHGPRLETAAIGKAAFALTTSKELLRIASKKNDRVYYLPNAADVSLFSERPDYLLERPAEFSSIKTPIIIYTGNIDHRVDYELIKSILENYPDKTLVMVGPRQLSKDLANELSQFPNLRFLGRRELWQLPMYLYFSQCAIIPFVCNELTKSIYPLKVNEYLAAGLPVVSTPFSGDIEGFSDVIQISESNIDFCYKISIAIDCDTPELRQMRIKAAMSNNWENRVKEFWNIVNGTPQMAPAMQA